VNITNVIFFRAEIIFFKQPLEIISLSDIKSVDQMYFYIDNSKTFKKLNDRFNFWHLIGESMYGCFESLSALSAPNSVRRNSLLSCAIPPSPAFSVLTALGDYCNFVSKLSLLVRLCSTLDMWLTLNRFKLFSNPSLEEIANNTTNCLHNIREIVQILEMVCIHNNIYCGNISS